MKDDDAADAIERNDMNELRGELGDLLLQVVFHALLAEGDGGRTGTGAKGVQSCRQSA